MSTNNLRVSTALPEGPWLKSKPAAEEPGIHYKTLNTLKRKSFLEARKHYIVAIVGRNVAFIAFPKVMNRLVKQHWMIRKELMQEMMPAKR